MPLFMPRWFVRVVLGFAVAGCTASNGGGLDAQSDVRDGSSFVDAADADATVDAPACNGPTVESLAALSIMVPDGGLSITTTNGNAPDGVGNALQPGVSCGFGVVHERLFAYTMHTTAALRVSTDNPGSDATFDTVLFVTRAPCTLPPSVLACNDDDPFAPSNPHVTLSLATTPVLPVGTTVIIGVGGFYPPPGSTRQPDPLSAQGMFTLTAVELPGVALGGACDPSGVANVCAPGSTCITTTIGGTTATCVADGSIAGGACLTDGTCSTGLTCDTGADRCYAVQPVGGACDHLRNGARFRCADSATCVSTVYNSTHGTCRANGTALAVCLMGNTCADATLRCQAFPGSPTFCALIAPSGGTCTRYDMPCPTGESCVLEGANANVGRCTADGTVLGAACRADVPECDGNAACITSYVDRTCRAVSRTVGGPCNAQTVCSYDWGCVVPDPAAAQTGACTPRGSQGAPCVATGAACNVGLYCTDTMDRSNGVCLVSVPRGGACDMPRRLASCAAGTGCVRATTSGAMGTCVSLGTAPGAPCRTTGTACDGALVCTGGTCRQASADGSCDPRYNTLACPTPQLCLSTAIDSGHCAAAGHETEPNDAVPAMAVTVPAVIDARLDGYDVDCYGMDVTAGQSVFAAVSDANGGCPGSIALDLYGPTAVRLGTDTSDGIAGCPRIEGGDAVSFTWAHALAAGRYTVCVRESSNRSAVPEYTLSLAVTGP